MFARCLVHIADLNATNRVSARSVLIELEDCFFLLWNFRDDLYTSPSLEFSK